MRFLTFTAIHCVIVIGLFFAGACVSYAGGPTAIIAPNGTITYVYPGTSPGAPTTILPSTGGPTFVYPSPAPGRPATILPPTGGPSFAYPPIGQVPSAPVYSAPAYSSPSYSVPGLTPDTSPYIGTGVGE